MSEELLQKEVSVPSISMMEQDAIGEVLNISMGSSATAVSSLLDRQVNISTPSVSSLHDIPILVSSSTTTFILSAIGLKVGNVFGTKYKSKAELAGGIILILIGTKILLEHLGVINF